MSATATSTWVEFTEAREVNYEGEMKSFEKGAKVAFDQKAADALITLGYAKEIDAPEDDNDIEGFMKNLADRTEKMIQKSLQASFANIDEKLGTTLEVELDNFAKAKGPYADLEKEFGFKEPDHFFKCVAESAKQTPDMTLPGMEFLQKAPSGQNISSDSEGNLLVPEPIVNRLWSNAEQEPESLMNRALQLTTAGNSLKLPEMFEPSRKTGKGQRNGGIIAYWENEADQHTPSKFTTGGLAFELNKLAVLTYATDELLEDSGFNIEGIFGGLAAGAINYAINEAIVTGTGVGQPKGILRDDALIVVSAEAGQADFTILHHNLNKLYWRNMKRDTAVWLVHPGLAQQLEFVYFNDDASNQRPVYLPANQVVNSPFGLLYGRPVIPFEFMNAFGDEGDVLFADISQYGILRKAGAGVKRARSIHVRFLHDETAFKWTFRIDGRGLWKSAKEDLKGDTTRSWCTTLAARNSGTTSSGV